MHITSGRLHSNGQANRICRFEDLGANYFMAELGPLRHPYTVGRHPTEAEAQAEADQIMSDGGHACSGECTPWEPVS